MKQYIIINFLDNIFSIVSCFLNAFWGAFSKLRFYIAVLLIAFVFLACGCSLPRIIILDDKLTPEEHIALGAAYEKKGLLDIAIKEYEAAAKKNPIAFLYLGNAYFLKNDFDSAEKYYKKTIKDKPEHADAYNNLAWMYYIKRENLAEAESLAVKAVELNPEKKEVYMDTLEKIRGLRKP